MANDARHWEWPDELDALIAAPQNHRLLVENDRVRVLQTHVAVAARTPVHTHRWPSVEYVQKTTDFIRYGGIGNIQFDTRVAHARPAVSEVLWSESLPPHSLENVGDAELRVIMVELKERENGPR